MFVPQFFACYKRTSVRYIEPTHSKPYIYIEQVFVYKHIKPNNTSALKADKTKISFKYDTQTNCVSFIIA